MEEGEKLSRPEKEEGASKILHMIGNAHLDPIWMWRWTEGMETALATFRAALERMEETEEFVFTGSSTLLYQWVKEIAPDTFERIRERVKEGRWAIVGGWVVEPDCNMPRGESFVRHGLYGQRFFLEEFGKKARVGYNVDSFGHNHMLPQILKKSGLDYYVFKRPGSHEKELPSELFRWQSPDGSEVLAFRPPSYGDVGRRLEENVGGALEELKEEKAIGEETMRFHGVGDHGGGPTKESIKYIQELAEEEDEVRVKFSSPEEFFRSMESERSRLPVVKEELQHHAVGCYSAKSDVKRKNRKVEGALLRAEKFARLADLLTHREYGRKLFRRAWKDLLFAQFHDVLPGTSIPSAYEDVRAMLGEAEIIAQRVQEKALAALSDRIDLAGEGEEGVPVVVYNPAARAKEEAIEFELPRTVPGISGSGRFGTEDFRLLDPEGRSVPYQLIGVENQAGARTGLAFVDRLPALGYRTYRVVEETDLEFGFEGEEEKEENDAPLLEVNPHLLANERFRVEFDRETGSVKSLFDKGEGVEVASGPGLATPLVLDDPSDTWSHGVRSYDEVEGRFGEPEFKVVESGPLRGKVRVKSFYGNSELWQDFILYRDLEMIECRVRVDWHEKRKAFKLAFPTSIEEGEATYEIPFGHVTRPPDGEEEPALSWVDLSGSPRDGSEGKRYGLGLVQDNSYGYDVRGSELRMTVLRNPVYAHHDPKELSEGEDYLYTDEGGHSFRYRLFPHGGGWRERGLFEEANSLINSPLVRPTHNHEGDLPLEKGFVEIKGDNLALAALKKAEDSEGTILRVYETWGFPAEGRIILSQPDFSWQVKLDPHEVKTFRLGEDKEGGMEVIEMDMLELEEW